MAIIQDKEKILLWDSNGFSFQSRDVSKFTKDFFRVVEAHYGKEEVLNAYISTLRLFIYGVNTRGSALDVPVQIDPRYVPPSQLPHEVNFVIITGQNPGTDALKIKMDPTPFLPLLSCPLLSCSQAFLAPFLAQAMFLVYRLGQVGADYESKANFLATPHKKAWETFCSAFKKDFALVRAFQAVEKFCEKSYDLFLPKHGREARKACFKRIQSFCESVRDQLNTLGDLNHIAEAFNTPEAKAIAEHFSRASFQYKTQILDNYILAKGRIEKEKELRIEAFRQKTPSVTRSVFHIYAALEDVKKIPELIGR